MFHSHSFHICREPLSTIQPPAECHRSADAATHCLTIRPTADLDLSFFAPIGRLEELAIQILVAIRDAKRTPVSEGGAMPVSPRLETTPPAYTQMLGRVDRSLADSPPILVDNGEALKLRSQPAPDYHSGNVDESRVGVNRLCSVCHKNMEVDEIERDMTMHLACVPF